MVSGVSIIPEHYTLDVTGDAIDFNNGSTFVNVYSDISVIVVPMIGETIPGYVEESDTGSSGWTNVVNLTPAGVGNNFQHVQITRTKRYLRARFVLSSGSEADICVIMSSGDAMAIPYHQIPYTPNTPYDNESDYESIFVNKGEGIGFQFFPVAAGTITPEVPTALDDVTNLEIRFTGNLTLTLVPVTNFTVDGISGRITLPSNTDYSSAMSNYSVGAISLWKTGPGEDVMLLARRVIRCIP